MIMLILEIVLTIVAWRKGWKAWALLPLGAGFGLGVIMGLLGIIPDETSALWLVPDLAAIIALIIMAAKGRQTLPKPVQVNSTST